MTARIHTPQALREKLVAYYMRAYTRAYGHADRASIERKVVADLEYVEAVKGAARATRPAPARVARPPAERPNVLERSDIDPSLKGLKLTKDDPNVRYYYCSVLDGNPQLVSEQWGAAVARIKRILEGTGGSAVFSQAVTNATMPKLAARVIEVWSFYKNRGRPAPARGVDHNPFRGLSNRDAFRMYQRLMMDICDRSTGVLGSWYVK